MNRASTWPSLWPLLVRSKIKPCPTAQFALASWAFWAKSAPFPSRRNASRKPKNSATSIFTAPLPTPICPKLSRIAKEMTIERQTKKLYGLISQVETVPVGCENLATKTPRHPSLDSIATPSPLPIPPSRPTPPPSVQPPPESNPTIAG